MSDRARLYAAATLRSSGVGFASAVLAIYLDKRGYPPAAIGARLLVGSTVKIAYDLLLWREFRHVRPSE